MNAEVRLPRSTPEAESVSAEAIGDLIRELDSLDAVHSVMLLRHGKVIAEGWWHPYRADRPHSMYSISKSFTSAAVGLAISEGLLGLDDRVVDLLPDEVPPTVDADLPKMTVRHLLTMTSGHGVDSFGIAWTVPDHWASAVLAEPVTYEPGTRFVYDTGATYLLSAIIQRLTGERLLDYLAPRLFAPLGITPGWWEQSPDGIDQGGSGLGLTTEDMAAFGQLLLQGGEWVGTSVLPRDWVEQATSFQVPNDRPGEAPDWVQGYGFQFWQCRHGAFRGDGAFGQFIVVMPEQDAVLAITGGLTEMFEVLDAVWANLLPGFDAAPQVVGPEANGELGERLSALALPVQHGRPSSSRSEAFESTRFELQDPLPGLHRIRVVPASEGSWKVELATDAGEQSFPIGYGRWLDGRTSVLFGVPMNVSASGGWLDDAFVVKVVFTDTPFTITVTMDVTDAGAIMHVRQNASFDGPANLGVYRLTPAR